MAKKRLQLDGNFEVEVYRAASGVEGVGRRFRTRRTTLEQVAEDIVAEAQRIVDMPARTGSARDRGGLPARVKGGGRNINYPFRRSGTGPTYRSSFRAKVEKRGGRLAVVVSNEHPYAGDVEFGTKRYGSRIVAKKKYLKIPITEAKYRQMQKRRNVSAADRRARAMRKGAGGVKPLKTFVSRDDSGLPFMYTRSVRTWSGYKILRRAMRNVARKKFG